MRVAETRAVNRALRKAYGIGLCSVEELGWPPKSNTPGPRDCEKVPSNGNNGIQNGQPRLRDRLCLLIRQYQLDTSLVKAYAADYCGTSTLRDASREQIEAFVNDLAERAVKDRNGLICQLNRYSKSRIQYLLAPITEEQRQEFGQVVEATVHQIDTAQFASRLGIRFPQNGCVSCAHLGLCLGNPSLVETKLIRQPAADLDWLDLLDD